MIYQMGHLHWIPIAVINIRIMMRSMQPTFRALRLWGLFYSKQQVRLENTNMTGHQLFSSDTSFSIHRTDPVSYVYLSRRLYENFKLWARAYLISRRSITRQLLWIFKSQYPVYRSVSVWNGNPSLDTVYSNLWSEYFSSGHAGICHWKELSVIFLPM